MSISSKSRKESTESYAAQGMRNTMGIPPELAQLNDKNLDNELPSRVAESNDTDVPGDYEQAKAEVALNKDEDEPAERVPDADWNRSTTEESVPATRSNEPDRTLGNS